MKINPGAAEDTFIACVSEGTVKYFKPASQGTNLLHINSIYVYNDIIPNVEIKQPRTPS